jgi:hypothetical protein
MCGKMETTVGECYCFYSSLFKRNEKNYNTVFAMRFESYVLCFQNTDRTRQRCT